MILARPHAVIQRVFCVGGFLVTTIKRTDIKLVVSALAYYLNQIFTLRM